ncbi:hypothetical protein BHE74_00059841 [Ensete ventricosum]|nr:hypothetical protein BHE74_00059841 [Ensete ventricosum]
MGSRTSMVLRKNMTAINFAQSRARTESRLVFHAPSQKIKILAIPNILAHGKSYEHCFRKKCNGHKVCTKSYEHCFTKNATIINFAQSHVRSRVSIGFSCTVSEIQKIGHSQ